MSEPDENGQDAQDQQDDDNTGEMHLTTHATVLSGTGAVTRKQFVEELKPTALFT